MTLHFGKVHSAHDIADGSAWLVIWRGGDSQAKGKKNPPLERRIFFARSPDYHLLAISPATHSSQQYHVLNEPYQNVMSS